MRALLRQLRRARHKYQPLIKVRISQQALESNYAAFSRKLGALRVAPVLKSNAYGHGLIPVAKVVDRLNPPFIVVDSYYEALVLRNERVRSPLLVIGYTQLQNIAARVLPNVAFAIVGLEQLEQLSRALTVPRIFHLKLDTGMHRQGVPLEELDRALSLIRANSNIVVEGLCTHLADADGVAPNFTRNQIQAWNTAIKLCKAKMSGIAYTHVAATAGTRYSADIEANVVRVGLGLYGLTTADVGVELKPALSLVTSVASVRTLKPGECIGYNCTYKASSECRVATVPMGYFEGIDRRLSGKGSLSIGGRNCPILGRVSMNITSVDVTDVPQVRVGDEVVVISADPVRPNSVSQAAKIAGTIPYDLLVHIPQHLRRVIV